MSVATIEERIKEAGLLDFSGDEGMSPELIEDAIEGTLEMYKNINMEELAARIAARETAAKLSGSI